MAGLMWKDVLYIKKIWKIVLLFGGFFLIFSLVQGNGFSGMVFVAILVGGNFSILPFSCDSYSKWNEYQYAFPVSKKTVVCSRYLFGLLLFGICLLLSVVGIVLYKIEVVVIGATDTTVTIDYICSEMLPVFIVPFAQAISFPLLYRFGVERGRLYVTCAVVVIAAVAAILGIQVYATKGYCAAFVGIVVAAVLLYSISLLLSIHIEEKKIK